MSRLQGKSNNNNTEPAQYFTGTSVSGKYGIDVNVISGGGTGGAGDASAANQVLANTKLDTIATKLPALVAGKMPVDVVISSVSVSNFPSTQPVSGSISVSNFPATGLTDTQLRAAPVPISGNVSISGGGDASAANQLLGNVSLSSIDNKTPALGQALAGASTPVVLPAAQITALTPLSSVSVSNFPVIQPVSGTVTATGPLTDTQLRATAVPVSGPLTDTQLRASAVPVSGTFFQGTQPVSASTLPLPAGAATSALQTTGNTSVGSIDAKTPALGQALAAASVPVVLTAAQMTTLTPLSSVSVSNFPASQTVTGTFFQATQPVSLASAPTTPVTGTFWQTTQPVSGPLTDTQLRASAVPVTGTVTTTNTANGSTGLAVPTVATMVGGSDGTNLKALKVSSAGVLSVDSSAVTQPVSGTFFQVTQPVSIASMPSTPVTGTFFQATQPVSAAALPLPSGASTEATLSALNGKVPALGQALAAASTPVVLTAAQLSTLTPLSSVSVSNFPATQPVSIASMPTTPVTGTFFQATQPVSLATAPTTPVTGTFWQATQPVSGTVSANATLAAETTKVIGTVNIAAAQSMTANAGTNLNTSALALDSTVAKDASLTTLNTSVNSLLKPASTLAALTSITNTVTTSLGNSAGKTLVMKTGTLVTTAATADQVILTYTVTAGKTFYIEYFDISCRLTTFAATATNFGNASLESPASTKLYTQIIAGTGVVTTPVGPTLAEPIPISAGVVIRVVCTPSTVTSFTWTANFGGYEK